MAIDDTTSPTGKGRNAALLFGLVGLAVGAPAGYVAAGHRGPPPPPPAADGAMRGMDHAAMGHGAAMSGTPARGPETPAQRAFREANERMHAGMTAPSTGDVDLDFARGMVPHHEGAVDMANVQLRYGSDPEMKSLAIKVVKTQQAEIEQMREWITRRETRSR